ncbi:MAG: MATE family efflux transporter, partial [Clostridia bacterium]|nr:MATE family efflux transporter [Clostridia bacterium]
ETLAGGTVYLQIQMLGIFTMAITSVVTSTLRATGDSKTAMIYNTTANLLNVVFNYLLIFGNFGFPRLEVAGASIATVIGQFVACIMALAAIMSKKQYARLELKDGFKPHKKTIKDIFAIGMPAMGERMAMRVGMIIYAKTVASLGTVALATHQVCMNIQALTFMNGEAFSVSATSLVGQSLGKRRADMAVHYSKRTQKLGMIVSAIIAVVVFFFNKQIIGLYNNDLEIINMGSPLLQMVAIIQPLQALQFISAGVLRGAGDTKYTAYVSSATVMILRPALAIILISFFHTGLVGAWYALVADQLLRTLLIVARYNSGKWRNVMLYHDAGKLA